MTLASHAYERTDGSGYFRSLGQDGITAQQGTLAAANSEALPVQARPAGLLTERETDVLRRISLGESNKEAARSLELSPSTVRTHVENIFRKLECSTRAAATLKALTLGLI